MSRLSPSIFIWGSQPSQAGIDHHFLIYGTPIPDDVLAGIVDNVLLPLLTQAPRVSRLE
jgi:hypothetical protein